MKTISFLLFFVSGLLCSSPLGAQSITFEKWYGGASNEGSRYVQQTPDSGYIAVGTTGSFGNGNQVYLIRMDQYGDTLWTKNYGGPNAETGYSVEPTPDGGFIIASTTNSYGPGIPTYSNWYIIKTDGSGNVQWTKTYGTSVNDWAYHCIPVANGYVAVGYMYPSSGHAVLLKLDNNGSILWGDTLYGAGQSCYMNCLEDPNGDIVVTGTAYVATYDVVVSKYTSSGTNLYTKTYDKAPSSSQFADNGVTIRKIQNGYMVAATTGNSLKDPWMLRLNNALDTLWSKPLLYSFYLNSFFGNDYFMETTTGGGLVFAGMGFYNSAQVAMVKTDSLGNIQWTNNFGSSYDEWGYCIQKTNDGGFVMAAYGDLSSPNTQAYIVKTDSLGNTSFTTGHHSMQQKGNSFSLYPVPADQYVFVAVPEFLHGRELHIGLYDISGRLILSENNFRNDAGIDLTAVTPGIYLLRLVSGEIMETRKLVIVHR